jgi:hypothetical protein
VTARVRAVGPWLLTAAVCAAIVCATTWPLPTGWAVGSAVGAGALTHGVRMLLEERRQKTAAARSSTCTGCIGCGCPTDHAPADQMGQQ